MTGDLPLLLSVCFGARPLAAMGRVPPIADRQRPATSGQSTPISKCPTIDHPKSMLRAIRC